MDKLRIGSIGVSGRGALARHWHQPGPKGRSLVVAGADTNEQFLANFKEKVNPDAFVTTDYRKLLERDDIDAVAVTVPDFLHEEIACAALQAGKHVFCEKPMAITVEGCDRMLETARASGKKLFIGHNMRYMDIFRTMKEIVDAGVIGEIKAVWVRHFVGLGGRFYFHDWHARRDRANTLLLQKGSHDIDMIHWITGRYSKRVAAFGSLDYFGGERPNDLICPECDEFKTCPDAQASWPGHEQCAYRREIDVEDNQVMIMQLEGGIKASYLQCHFTPEYFRNYTFIGTEGRLENLDDSSKIIVKTRRRFGAKGLADRVYEVKPAEGGHGGADPVICEDFLDLVLLDKPTVATPLAGRMAVATGCAGAESMRQGGVVVDIPQPPAWVTE
ncbi:MAG TPA: Gfo/Idh/MocA family oxidoreductase [Armatimonadota bacterium]|nr:Gfo/Idh/MocA family oxidoreductase [Armatimonadota bacterium]HOJ21910.1 Gfo/Idh/MocA family oxidoreductase [Armatimonadota bacterium]HOM82873.1 Gfo/Idh/MocA family oxidoreductase [Armatimonadota bacterium]HOQ27538.1 Gfo/Idh/MocA family oxidoreductase [Armatimonadota bacterium]HPO71740.1 Gfo/Idh/MocA family oxidoreductase [Armatimonadota bacterium]